MGMQIDLTETRQEIGDRGTAYVIETYAISDRSGTAMAMTNLSISGWRIIASHIWPSSDGPTLIVVWEWHGPKGGRHFRRPPVHYRF